MSTATDDLLAQFMGGVDPDRLAAARDYVLYEETNPSGIEPVGKFFPDIDPKDFKLDEYRQAIRGNVQYAQARRSGRQRPAPPPISDEDRRKLAEADQWYRETRPAVVEQIKRKTGKHPNRITDDDVKFELDQQAEKDWELEYAANLFVDPKEPALTTAVATGIGAGLLGMVPGSQDAADAAEVMGRAGQISAKGSVIPEWINRAIQGATRSATQMVGVGAAGGGLKSMIAAAGATEGNQAFLEARKKGWSVPDSLKYATLQGAIESGLTVAGNRLFGGGLEKQIADLFKDGARKTAREVLRQVPKNIWAEVREEFGVEHGHIIGEQFGPDAAAKAKNLPDEYWQRMGDVLAQTILMGGFTGATGALMARFARRAPPAVPDPELETTATPMGPLPEIEPPVEAGPQITPEGYARRQQAEQEIDRQTEPAKPTAVPPTPEQFVKDNQEAAATLAAIQDPSRKDFERLGLPVSNAAGRKAFAEGVRGFLVGSPGAGVAEPVNQSPPESAPITPETPQTAPEGVNQPPAFQLEQQPAETEPPPKQQPIEVEKQKQKTLLSGLDALPGQKDLFEDIDKAVSEAEKPAETVSVSDIKVDPRKFQFKAGADPVTGVVDEDRLEGEFNTQSGGHLLLWQAKDGTLYLAEGHHRLDLMRRRGIKKATAVIHKESDGVTTEDARALGAMSNIRAQAGKVVDYARFFKVAGITEADAKRAGLLARQAGRAGFSIGTKAADDVWAAYTGERISEEAAAAISDAAPGDAGLQAVGLKLPGLNDLSGDQIRDAIKILVLKSQNVKQSQGDLFGFDDSALQEAVELSAKAAEFVKERRRYLTAVRGAINNPEEAAAMGLTGDMASIEREAKKIKDELAEWKNWTTNPKLVAQLRGEVEPEPEGETDTMGSPEADSIPETPEEITDEPEPADTPDPDEAFGAPVVGSKARVAKTAVDTSVQTAIGIVNPRDIMRAMARSVKALGQAIPVRGKRGVKQHHALGIFKIKAAVIRLLRANSIPVLIHEYGHAIEKLVFGWPKGGPWKSGLIGKSAQAELHALGKALYGDRTPNGGYKREGFAEFMRLYVTDRPAAQTAAPDFYKWFGSVFMAGKGSFPDHIEEASKLAHRWMQMKGPEVAKAMIVDPGTVKARLKRLWGHFRKATNVQKLVETLDPYYQLEKAAEQEIGQKIPHKMSPYRLAKAHRMQASAVVELMLDTGMVDFNRNVVGPPLLDINALVRPAEADQFQGYLYARRAAALWTKNKDVGLSKPQIKEIFAEVNQDKDKSNRFEKAALKMYAWWDGVLDYMAQADPTMAEHVRQVRAKDPGDYVPLKVIFDEMDEVLERGRGGPAAATGRISKRLAGSGRQKRDLLTATVEEATRKVSLANERRVMSQVVRLGLEVENMGDIIEEVPLDKVKQTFAVQFKQVVESLKESLDASGIDTEGLDEFLGGDGDIGDLPPIVLTFWTPSVLPKGSEPIFPYWDGKKVRWFHLKQPGLFETLSHLDAHRLPPLIDMTLGATARASRAGTTVLRPAFGLAVNPLKDLRTWLLNTISNANAAKILFYWVERMFRAGLHHGSLGVISDPWILMAKRLGVPMSQSLAQDVPHARRAARRLVAGWTVRTLDPRNVYDAFRDFIQFPESAVRSGELKLLAKELGIKPTDSLTEEQFLFLHLAATGVTVDFREGGEYTKIWNQVRPFVTANIAGPRAAIRAARTKGLGPFIGRGLTLSWLSLLAWWKFKDDDWWKSLNPWEKFTNNWIPLEVGERKELLRLPMAHDFALAFSSVPIALADAAYNNDPSEITDWMEQMVRSAMPSLMPPIVQTYMEQLANTQWPGRPIVPQGMENRPAQEQYNEHTAWAAKQIGRIFNVSPLRVEHALKGVFGPLATDVAKAPESLAHVLGFSDREVEMADIPVFGTLFRRGGSVGMRPKEVQEMYDLIEQHVERQYSKENPETESGRQARLMLQDAAKGVQALFWARTHAKELKQRDALGRAGVQLAKDAIKQIKSKKIDREPIKDRKKFAEGARELAK